MDQAVAASNHAPANMTDEHANITAAAALPAARRSAEPPVDELPIPPQFVRMLATHTERFGVALDGWLFRNREGNYAEASAYGLTWARARKHALTRVELASGLAERPYDLRHAGISFWLYSGVGPAECARRAGQSIEVLFRFRAKFLDGVREQAKRLIEQSMEERDRVCRRATPQPDRTWTGNRPEELVRSGLAVGEAGSYAT
ncbi:hypothetical protein ACFWWS_11115 [Streptomyces sp. NPDC059083]|uniref:hypothetical protein n=1 Tax=unclassified Streptomyces TaxID=2593676 RepID=UPI0036C9D7D1